MLTALAVGVWLIYRTLLLCLLLHVDHCMLGCGFMFNVSFLAERETRPCTHPQAWWQNRDQTCWIHSVSDSASAWLTSEEAVPKWSLISSDCFGWLEADAVVHQLPTQHVSAVTSPIGFLLPKFYVLRSSSNLKKHEICDVNHLWSPWRFTPSCSWHCPGDTLKGSLSNLWVFLIHFCSTAAKTEKNCGRLQK